jgi:hypothetical protein
LPAQQPCAPVLTGGPIVDAVWRRLLDRVGVRPGQPLTDDADLYLRVDGQRLDAMRRTGDTYVFRLPHVPSVLSIVSRAAVPAELGLARDPRVLGVGLRQIIVLQGARSSTIEASDERLTEGFHAFELENAIRWTDGDATVPGGMFDGFAGPIELRLLLSGRTRYVDDGLVRHAA